MASLRIKQGDEVVVISGPERGKRGSVTQVLKKSRQVVIEGVNLRKRHARFSGPGRPTGIIDFAAPMHISNVKLIDPATQQPTRVGKQTLADGRRVRYAKSSGEVVDNQ